MFKPDFSELDENPLKTLRGDMPIAQLARQTRITAQSIRDAEKGLLTNVPGSLMRFFASQSRASNLTEAYQQWKNQKRSLIYLPPVGPLSISSDDHPFVQYRKNILKISASELAEYLCIPRYVLNHYVQQQKKMPGVLKFDALPEAHLSELDIARLANLGEVFHTNKELARINAQANNNRV